MYLRKKENVRNKLYHQLLDNTNWEYFPELKTFASKAQEAAIAFNCGASWLLTLPEFRLENSSGEGMVYNILKSNR